MDKSSLNEQSVALPKHGERLALQQPVQLSVDEMTTISRSKLEHLKDLADDDRMKEPEWEVDRIFGSVAQGVFFTSVGGFLCFPQLPDYGKILCVIGFAVGLLFSMYWFFKERSERKRRKNHREKLVIKIDQIISSIDPDCHR